MLISPPLKSGLPYDENTTLMLLLLSPVDIARPCRPDTFADFSVAIANIALRSRYTILEDWIHL
jgi:hypothetical protein